MQLNLFNFRAANLFLPSAMRRVDFDDLKMLVKNRVPTSGDVALARVKQVGQKNYLLKAQGKTFREYASDSQVSVPLSEGQLVLVTYGNRYAVDEYRGLVPADLGDCHLVSSGGTAARIDTVNGAMEDLTVLEPLGLVARANGRVVNLQDYKLPPFSIPTAMKPPCVLVAGTGMNAGKSTAAAALSEGLSKGGHKVGYVKVTGTGNDGDPLKQKKAGAHSIYDFTDCGRSTTYRLPLSDTEMDFDVLTTRLAVEGCDICVVELADGIMMKENIATLKSEAFYKGVDTVLFAAADQAGAVMGVQRLFDMGYLPVAVSGKMTAAPLAMEEFLQDPVAIKMQIPCFTREDLCDSSVAERIFATARDLKKVHRLWNEKQISQDRYRLKIA